MQIIHASTSNYQIMSALDLKKLRAENGGLSQTEFAERLGIKLRTVQKYEKTGDIPPYMEKLISYEFLQSTESDYADSAVSEPTEKYNKESGLRMLSIFEDYIPDELADMYKKLQDELVDLYEYKELYYKAKEAYRPK